MPRDRKSLLIVLDAARFDETSAAFDASSLNLLRESARPTLIAPSCWTAPSVTSMLTGRFPSEHGRQWPLGGPYPPVPTIADLLEQAGRSFLMLSGNTLCAPPLLPLREDQVHRPHAGRRLGVAFGRTFRGLDYGSREILRRVERMAAQGMLPDLLVLHLQEALHPYLPPPKGIAAGVRLRYAAGHVGYYLRCAQRAWEFAARADEAAWADGRRRYGACVRYVVGMAEGVLQAYQRAGVMEETLAIITADHGEHLGEHGLADHQGSLHEELVHCPCALIAPPLRAGHAVRGQFQHTDLLRTICGWLSLPTGDCGSAWPALDMLDEPDSGGPRSAFAEWSARGEEQLRTLQRRNPTYDFAPLDRDLVAVRTERWKLIRGSDGSEMLFDLRSDQRESRNIAAQKPAVLRELRAALEKWLSALRPERRSHQHAGAPPAVEARLRELGYV